MESLKFRCQQQYRVFHQQIAAVKICRNLEKRKTKCASIVDADESMRIRLEGVPHRYHNDHIAAKGINSLSHYNLEHKFIPML